MNKRIIVIYVFTLLVSFVFAQKDRTQAITKSALIGLEYSIRAGINIGGTSPIPLPREIRSIESYNPTLTLSIGADVQKRFENKWGIMTGVHLETKGMETEAKVKNYHMRITTEDETKEGNFTGHVKTKVRNTYITIPMLATYRFAGRWDLKVGPYFSYVLSREFSGTAFDGYLRDGDPTGTKVEIDKEKPATYDLSSDLRHFQWGAQVGADWRAFSHLNVFADLQFGLNSIFRKDFETITFEMYPIYATLGFAYVF